MPDIRRGLRAWWTMVVADATWVIMGGTDSPARSRRERVMVRLHVTASLLGGVVVLAVVVYLVILGGSHV